MRPLPGSTPTSPCGRSELFATAALTAVFLASRAVFWTVGVRFDASTITWYLQFLDPVLLRTDLLRSVYYLHNQPPLFNLLLGVVLKLFPESYTTAFAVVYTFLGWVLILSLYALMRRLSTPRWLALTAAVAFIISPPCILYENWLFYTYPVTVALCAGGYFLHRFAEDLRWRDGLVFFFLLAALVLTRSLFQLFWLLFYVGLLAWQRRDGLRRILLCALLPLVLVLSVYTKNLYLFDRFTTSTWLGPSLWKISTAIVPEKEREALVAEHRLSPAALLDPFVFPATRYEALVPPVKPTGVPALDEVRRSTGAANPNNRAFLAISNLYLRDALWVIRTHPSAYLKGVHWAYIAFFEPASAYWLLAPNVVHIVPWDEFWHRFIYGCTNPILPSLSDPPAPADMGILVVLAYAVAIAYGGYDLLRAIRQGRTATARFLTVAYVWLNLLYVMVICNALEVGENNRFRFLTEPMAVVLLAACVSDSLSWLRPGRGIDERVSESLSH